MTAASYSVFISYSHRDTRWARWCQRALETYQVPKRIQAETGCPPRVGGVFRDADELGLASDLSETIQQALAASEYLLVICSPRAGASTWVNREVIEFQKLGRRDRIFCLLVDGDPADETCLPQALRNRREHAPLLVDPRSSGDGKRVALARIVASLLGLDFSRLKDREARRRYNRMIAITAVALVAVVVTSTLAVVAFDARDIALVERERAQRQALIASQSLDFMIDVFSVSDPSESRGNSVTARELLDRASVRIADELADDPGARITLMNTIASVYTNLGLYRSSIELLEQSLNAREVVNSRGTLEAAQTLTDLGGAYHHLGDYQQAIDLNQQALVIRRRLGADTAELAHNLDNIGAAYYFLDGYAEARDYMTRALDIRRELYPETNLEIATSLNNIGALSSELGDLVRTIDYQEQAWRAFREILGADNQRTLIVLNNLTLDMRERGLFDEAAPLYAELIELTETIHSPPHPDLANVYNNYGIYLLEIGEHQAALSHFQNAASQWLETLGGEHHRTLTAESLLGVTWFHLGELDMARQQLEATIERQKAALGSHSSMVTSLSELAVVFYALGRYEEGLEQAQGALAMAEERHPLNEGKQALYRGFVARGLSYLNQPGQALEIFRESHPLVMATFGAASAKTQRFERWQADAEVLENERAGRPAAG